MKRHHVRFSSQRGAILLEAIVALAVLIVILSAMSVVILVAVNNSSFIKSQNIANKYASQAIEYIRYMRENNYSTFQTYKTAPGLYCMADDNEITSTAESGPCGVNLASSFIREIEFEENSFDCRATLTQEQIDAGQEPNQLKATVTVYWAGSKCPNTSTRSRYCHKSQLVSCFGDKDNVGL